MARSHTHLTSFLLQPLLLCPTVAFTNQDNPPTHTHQAHKSDDLRNMSVESVFLGVTQGWVKLTVKGNQDMHPLLISLDWTGLK